MNDPLQKLPGYVLRRAANTLASELVQCLAPLNLRQVDVTILVLIQSNPGVTASAIARSLDIQPANMVPLMKRLEDAGLITRTPIDKKSQRVALTEDGTATLCEAMEVIDKFETGLIERVPIAHRPHLMPVLMSLWKRD
jgi:DNA-binding MarR family transcriptional regulator